MRRPLSRGRVVCALMISALSSSAELFAPVTSPAAGGAAVASVLAPGKVVGHGMIAWWSADGRRLLVSRPDFAKMSVLCPSEYDAIDDALLDVTTGREIALGAGTGRARDLRFLDHEGPRVLAANTCMGGSPGRVVVGEQQRDGVLGRMRTVYENSSGAFDAWLSPTGASVYVQADMRTTIRIDLAKGTTTPANVREAMASRGEQMADGTIYAWGIDARIHHVRADSTEIGTPRPGTAVDVYDRGRRVAILSGARLRLQGPDGASEVTLPRDPQVAKVFGSPDGTRVAVIGTDGKNSGSGFVALVHDGRVETIDAADPIGAAWSDDGRRFAYNRGDEIVVVDVAAKR